MPTRYSDMRWPSDSLSKPKLECAAGCAHNASLLQPPLPRHHFTVSVLGIACTCRLPCHYGIMVINCYFYVVFLTVIAELLSLLVGYDLESLLVFPTIYPRAK